MKFSLRVSLILFTSLLTTAAFSQFYQSDAFLWTSTGGMQDLGVLMGWQGSYRYGLNQAGVIVGGLSKANGGNEVFTAFAWKQNALPRGVKS